jgi:endonuclease G
MATKKSARKVKPGSADKIKREQELIQLVRQKAQAYLRLPNVTSVGVGYEIKDGKETGELAIQFTVARKLSPEALVAENLDPLPEYFVADDGTVVPVDVVERSYGAAYRIIDDPRPGRLEAAELTPRQIRRSRRDPIMPGISVAHVDLSAGTIGAVVFDAQNGSPFILSNWHVLNGPAGRIGDQIVQPGAWDDGNTSSNTVGQLVRSHLGLAGDCAIASVVGRGLNPSVFERDVIPRRVGLASISDQVVKSGRTTGVTFGVVRRVGVVVTINYGAGFEQQQVGGFEIGPNPDKPPANGEISMGGDSGSVWTVDTEGPDKDVVLGLHFAGELDPRPEEEHALACNIHSVLEKLQVSLVNPMSEPQSGAGDRARRRRRRR